MKKQKSPRKSLMKHRCFKKLIAVTLTCAIAISAMIIPTSAYVQDSSGVLKNTGANYDGNFFRTQIGNMDANWSSATAETKNRYIAHTTYLYFASGTWAECGDMQGGIKEPGGVVGYWNGSYFSTTVQLSGGSSVITYKIPGPSASVGAWHTYQIARKSGSGGSYNWGIYVDYVSEVTLSNNYMYGSHAYVGVVTNDSVTTSAEWNEANIQRIVGGSWYDWVRANNTLQSANDGHVRYTNSSTGNSIITSVD